MFKKLIIVVAVVLIAMGAYVATRPSEFKIERQIAVAAPAAVPYGLVADLHQWQSWSPWEKLDPQQKRTFEGPASGPGSAYHWDGNKKVGEGRMTITQLQPSSHVGVELAFLKPWKATNNVDFTFEPAASGMTNVRWTMSGHNGFVGKAMHAVMDMDKMVGPDFERGLANLKAQSESLAKAKPAAMPQGTQAQAATGNPNVARP